MIGQRLKELRAEKGISQQKLADAAGLHRSVVAAYETNLRYPKEENLNKIKEALSITDDDIFTEEIKQKCIERLSKEATAVQVVRIYRSVFILEPKRKLMKGL